MAHEFQVEVDPALAPLLAGHRLHVVLFGGARVGTGGRDLDALREKVIARLRPVLESYRDLFRMPQVAAFVPLLTHLGREPRRSPPVHARLLRALARREPFPVENDARDAANLASLHDRLPVFVLDRRALRPPLRLVVGAGSWSRRDPGGPVSMAGEPVLVDERGPVAGLEGGVLRATVTNATRELVMVVWDAGVEGGLDHERLASRLQNWMATLTGARLLGSAASEATRAGGA